MISKDRLRIVLVEPEQPRNVGAIVRVAANFGLYELTIVRQHEFTEDDLKDVRVASSGATELVDLRWTLSLAAALEGADTVIATSARRRDEKVPTIQSINDFPAAEGTTAVVFGRESAGLTREEMGYCHALLRLPVSDQFASMNLSHAIAIVIYQALFCGGTPEAPATEQRPVTETGSRNLQERWLEELQSANPAAIPQLRRLLHRAEPSAEDMAMLFNIVRKCRRPAGEN